MKKTLFVFIACLMFLLSALPAFGKTSTLSFVSNSNSQAHRQNAAVIANLDHARSMAIIDFKKLQNVVRIDYTLTYNYSSIPQGVIGSITPTREKTIRKEIFLGTCSQSSCIFHSPTTAQLSVTTKYKSGKIVTTNYTVN